MRKEKPIVHSDTAEHKNKAHIKTHKGLPAPEGMLRGWWSAWMGAVITLELCVRSLRDEIKSLPLSSQSAPSTKEHHFPREKDTVCVYIRVCVWSYTQIRQKSSDTEKRLEIHTPGAYDKGNWRGASVCKRLWETQKDRLSIHKRDCASNFAVFPRPSHRELYTLEHNVSHLCKQISFHRACLLDQIQLGAACLASLCEYRQIYSMPFPYIYLLLLTRTYRFRKAYLPWKS